MKRFLPFAIVLPILVIIFWAYRWIFSYHFDANYYQEWYEHSQWSIPLSPRIMGDAELYQFSGLALVRGDSPFHINPETPPLGKYFYGASLLWFQNPYFASIFFYFVCLVIFLLLAKTLFSRHQMIWWAVFLFVISPIFFSQIIQVGLDIPQLCFLLLHILFLFLATRKKALTLPAIILSGLSLGAFAVTKFGVFTPAILLVSFWYLWQSYRKKPQVLALWAVQLCSVGLGYLAGYAPFFLQHHTLSEWFSAQKWIFHFYTSAHLRYIPLMILITILSGIFLSWWNGVMYARDWTLLWPIGAVIFFNQIKRNFFGKKSTVPLRWQYIGLLTIILFLTNGIVPFWPRYLILIFPFLILFVVRFWQSKKVWWQNWLVALLLIQAIWFLFPQPNETLDLAAQAWQSDSYSELYNFLDTPIHQKIDRPAFTRILQIVDQQLESTDKNVSIDTPYVWPWQNFAQTTLHLTYQTYFGKTHFDLPLQLHREQNQWRIAWQWDDVMPHFTTDSKIILQKDSHHDGTLKTGDNILISSPGNWPRLSVLPKQTKSVEDLVQPLVDVTGLASVDVRVKATVLSPAEFTIPIGFATPYYEPAELQYLATQSGIVIDQQPTRVYPRTVSQLPTFDIIQKTEKEYPELLGQPGGSLIIQHADGQGFTVYHQDNLDGKDVLLPQTSQQLFKKGDKNSGK